MLAEAERLQLSSSPDTRTATAPEANGLLTLAKLATGSFADIERGAAGRDRPVADADAAAIRPPSTPSTQGVCFFDAEDRVILSNRRFAEIYRLAPEQIRPGATLREIVELRIAAGTWATAADDYLSFCVSNHFSKEADRLDDRVARTAGLIQMRRQPMPGGGCVVTHEDITELKAARAAANERLSLQALIDRLPDNLWVKDVNSRFVIANQATATRMGMAGARRPDRQDRPRASSAGDRAEILRRRTGDRPHRTADDRQGGIRLGLQDLDLDDESAAAQRAQRNLRRGRRSRATSPSASWRTPCATGKRKSSK